MLTSTCQRPIANRAIVSPVLAPGPFHEWPMLRKFCCGFVPVLALACALFSPAVGQEGKAKKAGEKTFVACEDTNVVCPIYYWGYFGGSYKYMGYHCKDKVSVGLSSSIPLTLCQCHEEACTDRCIAIGSNFADKVVKPLKKRTGKRLGELRFYTEDILEDGCEPRESVLTNDKFLQPTTTVAKATAIGNGIPVRLYLNKAGTRWVRVALHTVQVEPVDQTVFTTKNFRVGYEFRTGGVMDNIPWEKIDKAHNGKYLIVSYRGEEYAVVLSKDTEDPEEKPSPAAARMPKGK